MGWLTGDDEQAPPTIVFAGGGTGGHLYPGIAVAEAVEQRRPEVEIAFVGTEDGIEARVIPETPWPLHLMDVPPLKGQGMKEALSRGLRLTRSGWQALSKVRELGPDLVVSLGGYAAGPFSMAAITAGTPAAIMEQNLRPGLTNRILGRFADRAFASFPESCSDFEGADCEVLGNPVRRAIREMAREFDYESPEEGSPFHILVTGGSGGAESLNRRLPDALVNLGDQAERLRVRHQYGQGRADELEGGYDGFAGDVEPVEFIDEMEEAYRWSDLVICRAGGTTIAEILALGLPALYVPSPHVTDDQQTKNARQIAEAGAGVMLPDDEIGAARATRLIAGLIANPISLQKLSDRARQRGRPDAAKAIADRCLELIDESG